jgi:HAE1 family hydrophobic/amphiphilic exporter-1
VNVAKWSVTRPVAVTMRIAALVLLGLICFLRIPVDLLPRVELGVVAVSTSWPNTSPEEMEAQITRPIEQAVSTVPGLYSVSSTSELGQSQVRITLNYGVDVDKAAVDVLQYVQRARREFPNDPTLQAPTVVKFDPNTFPILILGVSGIDDPTKLRTLLRNEIAPIFESAGGVAQVSISGGQDRAIIVDVDPSKLQAMGLTTTEIVRRLQAENISLPAGIAKQGQTEYTIRSVGYFESVEDARLTPVGSYNGRQVLLRDVADVRDESQEQRIFTRLNGEPAVGVTITKQSDANTVETAKNVEKALAQVEQRYPELKFGIAYDQSGFVEESVHLLQEHALIGGSLAILAILVFLRNLRSTLVVGLSIPISITSTFALMYFGGFTLNTISLSALALATGLIVDDAIVVLENIFRHIERDKRTPVDASVRGTQEIMAAVVASTLTVVVVFLPLFLVRGQSGQIFTQLALVVIFSLLVSLLDAATVVPMLASRAIKADEIEELEHPGLREQHGKKSTLLSRAFDRIGIFFHNMDEGYRRGLKWAIRHRWHVLAGAGILTVAVLPLWPMVGVESLPKTDSGDINVRVRLPIGTALETTYDKMMQVEQVLLADPDVETVFLAAGGNIGFRGAVGNPSSFEGSANVHLKKKRSGSTEEVVKRLQRQLGTIPGIRANANPFDLVANILGGNTQGMQVDVFGQNLTELTQTARQVMERLSGIPGLEGVDLNIQEATPELQWKVDRRKAEALGVSFQDIATAIGTGTRGALATYYQEGGFQYPIYVQLPEDERKSIEDLMRLPIKPSRQSVAGKNSPQITLGMVATPVEATGPNQINRLNRQRYVSVQGRIVDRPESEVQEDIRAALAGYELPRGMSWEFGERQRRRAEEFSGLGVAVFLAIALIYMLLASQFESFIYPLVVLFTVPLCVVGVILALFLSDRAFGLTAFVGLLMLIGIVVKNGILLVDYTNHLRGEGLNRDEAILRAAPTRLRPILMTSVCATLGMLPIAMSLGAASELQAPLATVVIGGLTTSTILTLFVVPVVYTLFDDLARRIRKDPRDLSSATMVEPSLSATGPSEEPVASVSEDRK